MTFGAVNALIPHVRSGKLRALAVSDPKRSGLLPDVPTVAEALSLPAYSVQLWYAVLVPAGTPRPIVERLNAEINKVVRDPQLQKDRLAPLGLEGVGSTPEQLAEVMASRDSEVREGGAGRQHHARVTARPCSASRSTRCTRGRERFGGRTITETDVVHFCMLTGNWLGLHADAEYAKRSRFGQRVVQGSLVFSIANAMLPFERDVVEAFYGVDRLRFPKPTFIGDTIRARAEVAALRERDDKTGIATVLLEAINQRDEMVMSCRFALVVLRERRAP